MQPARRLQRFPEYVFSRFNKIISEVEKESGRKVLNFGIGSPDFPPSKKYVTKLSEFLHMDDSHMYPGYGANKDFSQALISWYQKRFGVKLESNELFPLLGAKDATGHLPLAIADEGDEILVPNPGYPGFSGPMYLFGIVPVFYDLQQAYGFKLSLEEIAKKISPDTKALYLNFPSNPTGQIATIKDLEPVVRLAKEKHIFIIYDNAYAEIAFDGFIPPSILQIPGAKDVAVELGSFSKMFSFAGYRMGWIVGNKDIVGALAKVKSQLDSGMFAPLQNLGAFALQNPDTNWKKKMLTSYETRRDTIAKKLTKLDLTFDMPKGGLYIWAKI
ncbi:MAG: aminotransferase class I/II-fold pyridoxal phosphate-dependent enzyme, partial [Patescibacteria group bacterium]|nr:aminotransferase class I/II-fold pyridoxal phosphate-dependent enzyme [Patescibacteria group bacterium]